MDRDHSSPEFNVGAIQLHMSSFSQTGDFAVPAEKDLCTAPATIAHYDAGRDDSILPSIWSSKSKRIPSSIRKNLRPRSSLSDLAFKGALIVSHHTQHNATALCTSPESRGPDFISFDEGVFCDMTTRITWPLCCESDNEDCYDWKTHSLVERKLRKRKIRYLSIIEWK